MKKRVLILCTANSARSQMAEGLLRADQGDKFEVESAGTRKTQVRPEAIAVMKEIGIDISGHRSKVVDEFADQSFDHVLTVCDNATRATPYIRAMQTVFTTASKTRPQSKAQKKSASRRLEKFVTRSATTSATRRLRRAEALAVQQDPRCTRPVHL